MNLLVAVLISVFSQGVWASTKTSCNCGWVNRGRIIAGNETLKNEYPWVAALYDKHVGILRCGASIITPRHALTAAHCNNHEYVLSVGLHYSRRPKSGINVQIERIVSHPLYDDKYLFNDIAVVITRHQIPFSAIVGPVCLPGGPLSLDGQKIKALGWGRTSPDGHGSPVLLSADQTALSFEECQYYWTLTQPQTQLCLISSGPTTCIGDSGGPEVWLDPDMNRYTLVSLTSYGQAGCKIIKPKVTTAVGAFIPWINRIIAETSKESICTKI